MLWGLVKHAVVLRYLSCLANAMDCRPTLVGKARHFVVAGMFHVSETSAEQYNKLTATVAGLGCRHAGAELARPPAAAAQPE